MALSPFLRFVRSLLWWAGTCLNEIKRWPSSLPRIIPCIIFPHQTRFSDPFPFPSSSLSDDLPSFPPLPLPACSSYFHFLQLEPSLLLLARTLTTDTRLLPPPTLQLRLRSLPAPTFGSTIPSTTTLLPPLSPNPPSLFETTTPRLRLDRERSTLSLPIRVDTRGVEASLARPTARPRPPTRNTSRSLEEDFFPTERSTESPRRRSSLGRT